jgi:hypothetical protein
VVPGFVQDPGSFQPRGYGFPDVVGDVAELCDRGEQARRVSLGLEQAGHERGRVDAEELRGLEQVHVAVLELLEASAHLASPFRVHGLGGAGLGDDVLGLARGAARLAPTTDVVS